MVIQKRFDMSKFRIRVLCFFDVKVLDQKSDLDFMSSYSSSVSTEDIWQSSTSFKTQIFNGLSSSQKLSSLRDYMIVMSAHLEFLNKIWLSAGYADLPLTLLGHFVILGRCDRKHSLHGGRAIL